MTIIAKKVSRDGTVKNVSLNDEPTDSELKEALGGDPGKDDIDTIQWEDSWEILHCRSSDSFLIVGKPRYLGEEPRRVSCDIDDAKAKTVISLVPMP